MRPAVQTPLSNFDEITAAGAVDYSDEPLQTRQEFREEADVNVLMARYGVDAIDPRRIPQYGETDWDLDLHGAHIAMSQADVAFWHLPPELQEKYGSPLAMLDAMNSGELEQDLLADREKRQATPKPAGEDPPAPTPSPEPKDGDGAA